MHKALQKQKAFSASDQTVNKVEVYISFAHHSHIQSQILKLLQVNKKYKNAPESHQIISFLSKYKQEKH